MLSVVFGKTTPVFEPGEEILGEVVICATSQCRILDLTVNYVGISSVGFVVSQGKTSSLTCNKVEETDTHLDVLHPLVKSYRGIEIDPGVHTYSFAYCLPDLLPSSYNSPYGQISYHLQVHLQTSDTTQNLRSHFYVRASVNINLFKSSQCPQSAEVMEKYGMFGTKTFRLKTSVCKTCFVPGDVISVLVDVENGTSRHLRYLFCTLKQITQVLVQLQDRTESRVTKQNLKTVGHKVVENQTRYSWHCQFHSPTFLTPTISASTIVFVTYVVQVSAKLTRVSIPPQVQIPVVFGIRAPVLSKNPAPGTTDFTRHRSSLQDGIFSDNIQPHQSNPTVTNPRRRVTVCSQPKYHLLNSASRSAGTNYQRQNNDPMDGLEEVDLVCGMENVRNSQPNLNTPNRRRRFTICTQPKLHSIVITHQEEQSDNIHGHTHPNYISDLSIDALSPVDISSDFKRRISDVCNQTNSSLTDSVVRGHKYFQQDNNIPKPQERKNVFNSDYNCVLSQNPQNTLESSKQPISSKSNFSNSTRKVGIQLQTIASQVSRRLSSQWQSNFQNQFKRFDCEHIQLMAPVPPPQEPTHHPTVQHPSHIQENVLPPLSSSPHLADWTPLLPLTQTREQTLSLDRNLTKHEENRARLSPLVQSFSNEYRYYKKN